MTRRSASHDSKRPRSFHRHCRLFDAHNRGGIGRSTATSLGLLLLRNRGLAAKDILLDLASGWVRQVGHELDSLGTRELRQMLTSVIAQLGFRRGRACFQDDK